MHTSHRALAQVGSNTDGMQLIFMGCGPPSFGTKKTYSAHASDPKSEFVTLKLTFQGCTTGTPHKYTFEEHTYTETDRHTDRQGVITVPRIGRGFSWRFLWYPW